MKDELDDYDEDEDYDEDTEIDEDKLMEALEKEYLRDCRDGWKPKRKRGSPQSERILSIKKKLKAVRDSL